MTITINLPNVDKPDTTIDAQHIVLLAEREKTFGVSLLGDTNTLALAEQLAALYAQIKREDPRVFTATKLLIKLKHHADIKVEG